MDVKMNRWMDGARAEALRCCSLVTQHILHARAVERRLERAGETRFPGSRASKDPRAALLPDDERGERRGGRGGGEAKT